MDRAAPRRTVRLPPQLHGMVIRGKRRPDREPQR